MREKRMFFIKVLKALNILCFFFLAFGFIDLANGWRLRAAVALVAVHDEHELHFLVPVRGWNSFNSVLMEIQTLN